MKSLFLFRSLLIKDGISVPDIHVCFIIYFITILYNDFIKELHLNKMWYNYKGRNWRKKYMVHWKKTYDKVLKWFGKDKVKLVILVT